MTPEQAKLLLDFTLPTLKQEAATTAKVIAATPNANLDYRPSERCMPASQLLWHIASSDVMFIEGILKGTFGQGAEKPANVIIRPASAYKRVAPLISMFRST